MEADQVPEAPPSRPTASAWLAVGIMAAIALVAAGAIVAWGRLAAPPAEAIETGLDEELPESLADGRPFAAVPPVVAETVEGPVVGAVRVDEAPPELAGCPMFGIVLEDPTLQAAFVTGDALVVSYEGEGGEFAVPEGPPRPAPGPDPAAPAAEAPTTLVACTASWDGAWVPDDGGGVVSTASDMIGVSAAGSGCCTADGRSTATALVTVPEGAEWLVQDRGGYRLAYPVAGLEATAIAWRYREGPFRPGPPSTVVTFVDAEGDVVEETVVGF